MRRLRQQIQVNVIDTQPNVAVGLALPFNGTPVFNSNYTTKDQTKSNLLNYFLTGKGERVMNPNFGGDLRSFIFEQTPEFDQLQSYISDQLGIYFPQVNVVELDVNINPDANQVSISLTYSVNNQQDNINIQFNA
jgi:phage baseplate assembly protein W